MSETSPDESKTHSSFTRLDAIKAAWIDAEVEPELVTAQVDMSYLVEQLEAERRWKDEAQKDALYMKEQLEAAYPATPVDCLISELRDGYGFDHTHSLMTRAEFEERLAQFKAEVSSPATEPEEGG